MTEKTLNKKTKEVVKKIVKEADPDKIILFGSHAWGRPRKDSDVDLLIIKESSRTRRQRQRDLRMKLFPPGLPLDLLVYTPSEIKQRLSINDFFIKDILEKGKTLYAK